MDQTAVVDKVEADTSGKLSAKVGNTTKQEIKTAFDNLIVMRKDWEQNEFARSNQKLYQIFQHCYALYLEMKGVSAEKLALKRAFNSYLLDAGVKFKESTHLMILLTKTILLHMSKQNPLVLNLFSVLFIILTPNITLFTLYSQNLSSLMSLRIVLLAWRLLLLIFFLAILLRMNVQRLLK